MTKQGRRERKRARSLAMKTLVRTLRMLSDPDGYCEENGYGERGDDARHIAYMAASIKVAHALHSLSEGGVEGATGSP